MKPETRGRRPAPRARSPRRGSAGGPSSAPGALEVGVDEIGGGLGAAREGAHGFVVKDGQGLLLDVVGAVILEDVDKPARPREVDVDYRAHLAGDIGHDQEAIGEV